MTQQSDKREGQQNGYYVEFKRGWWMKSLGRDGTESAQQYGRYNGSVTEEQAKELERIVNDFLSDAPPPTNCHRACAT